MGDSLRPDVPLSRDEFRGLPWQVRSILMLTIGAALAAAGKDDDLLHLFDIDADFVAGAPTLGDLPTCSIASVGSWAPTRRRPRQTWC
jgi:hypothetical protein